MASALSFDRRAVVVHLLGLAACPAWPQGAERPASLLGHWRTTIILGDQATDRHLVLLADGRAQRWSVTARHREPPEPGSWHVEGKLLVLTFAGGQPSQAPHTFHNGQLVFPNIPNRRRFWDRV
jgi:hypothetical protein